MALNLDIDVPKKIEPIFKARERYIDIYGGRGSAKSWTVADLLVISGYRERLRILCTREIQNSIKDSVHKLLADTIEKHGLGVFYRVTEKSIIGANGTDFIFKGLRHNPNDIKSTEGIDIAWVEEAHSVSRKSLEILTPTVRKPGSQIIYTYNPTNDDDPVHVDYTLADRDDTLKIMVNYSDNPWFPDVLRAEMEWDKKTDYDKYLHKWEGQTVKHSEAQVLYGKWSVEDFGEPEGKTIFYYGADWGFAKEPTALIRCFIDGRMLYITHEAYGVGVDIDYTPALFDTVPDSRRNMIIADSARPETISYIARQGFRIKPAKKGKGSVEDGIQHLRGFEKIIVHPRCKNTIYEFRTYCYKVDERTGIVSTVLLDENNHIVDALRYALEDVMRARGQIKPSTISAARMGL